MSSLRSLRGCSLNQQPLSSASCNTSCSSSTQHSNNSAVPQPANILCGTTPSRRTFVLVDATAFQKLLVSRFPTLRSNLEEWKDLDHLQVMEFLTLTQSAIEAGSFDTVSECFEVATAALRDGDKALRNAIFVSYLEELDFRSDAGRRAAE